MKKYIQKFRLRLKIWYYLVCMKFIKDAKKQYVYRLAAKELYYELLN